MLADELCEGLYGGEQVLFEFSKKSARIKFIRKAYILLTIQMIINVAAMVMATYDSYYQAFIITYWWTLIIFGYITMSVGLLFAFVPELGRRFPLNWIVLFIFNALSCCFLSGIFCLTDTKSIVTSFGIVIAMCISITIYSFACKDDFKVCGGILFAFCGIAGAFVFLAILYPIRRLTLIAVAPLCMLYSIYLVYDTKLMVSSRDLAYQVDDYISASVILFWDFLKMLFQLFKSCVKSKHTFN